MFKFYFFLKQIKKKQKIIIPKGPLFLYFGQSLPKWLSCTSSFLSFYFDPSMCGCFDREPICYHLIPSFRFIACFQLKLYLVFLLAGVATSRLIILVMVLLDLGCGLKFSISSLLSPRDVGWPLLGGFSLLFRITSVSGIFVLHPILHFNVVLKRSLKMADLG